MNLKINAGMLCFGEVNTPRDVLESKYSAAFNEVDELGWNVTRAPLVCDDPAYEQAAEALDVLKGADYDCMLVCIAGWIPTHTVVKVLESFIDTPIVIWGLAGWRENGRIITTADQAGTTGLCFALRELGFKIRFVYSIIDKPSPIDKIESFAKAAMTIKRLRDIRIGTMGYRDMLLYGTMFDGLSLRREIGPEVEPFEMLEIVREADGFDESEVKEVIKYCKDNWKFQSPVDDEILEKGVRYYLAIAKKVKERNFEAVTLIDVDGMKKLEGFPPAMVFMLLADVLGVCTTPENDVLGNVMQLMVKGLTGQDAHYMEFYEFFEDGFLIGVPDYVPSSAVEGDAKILPAAFGQLSGSLLNVSKVRGGKVTLARLFMDKQGYKLHVVTGQAVQPEPWTECGWDEPVPDLPSLKVILDSDVDEFAQKVTSQHTIVAYGDITDELLQLTKLLDIEII
jgi:L-fucose isomerase-like protein